MRALSAAGLGWRRVAELAGMAPTAVCRLLYGGPGSRPPTRRVRPNTAEAILAIQPSPDALAPGAKVGITGTRRRVQALVATGWSQARLAERLGLSRSNFGAMMRCEQVTAATARAVSDLYDRLWNQPPPEHDQRTRIAASRSRHHAEREGWPPPLAWDDDQIDDPAARPAEGWKRPVRKTHVSAELAEDAEELICGQGYTREHAAARLGVGLSTLEQAISRASRAECRAAEAVHEAQRARFAEAARAPEAGYEAEAG